MFGGRKKRIEKLSAGAARNRLIFDGAAFDIMATFGADADRLVEYVSSFGTASAPSSPSPSSS